jgi:hypothetical protein
MRDLQRFSGTGPCLLATASVDGLSAEFPFKTQSSLLTFATDQLHPQLGNGLLVRLTIPLQPDPSELGAMVNMLNERELSGHTLVPLLGGWCTSPSGMPTFVAFYPNVQGFQNQLQNIFLGMTGRAKWVAERAFGSEWSPLTAAPAAVRAMGLAEETGSGPAKGAGSILDHIRNWLG